MTEGRCREEGKVYSHFLEFRKALRNKSIMELLPQKHSSQQRGKDECSEFLAFSLELHSLNLYSLFSLLADLQTQPKNGGVEVFLKYGLSKADFYACFSYRTLDVNGTLQNCYFQIPDNLCSVLILIQDILVFLFFFFFGSGPFVLKDRESITYLAFLQNMKRRFFFSFGLRNSSGLRRWKGKRKWGTFKTSFQLA